MFGMRQPHRHITGRQLAHHVVDIPNNRIGLLLAAIDRCNRLPHLGFILCQRQLMIQIAQRHFFHILFNQNQRPQNIPGDITNDDNLNRYHNRQHGKSDV